MKKAGLILMALVLGLTGCSAPQPAPKDFNIIFKYGVGAKNELDTFAGTYTRDMIGPPFFITVDLVLSKEELNKIYNKMVDIVFFGYPDKFSVPVPPGGSVTTITPYVSYYFKVTSGTGVKELRWDDEIKNQNDQAAKLRELIKVIRDIIESKPEYKKLPNPTSAYAYLDKSGEVFVI